MWGKYWGRMGIGAAVVAGLLVTPGVSDAQRRGWGWSGAGYDPWGYHNRNNDNATGSAQPGQALYPSEAPADPGTAGFTVRLPDDSAEVWFEDQPTNQKGILRQFVSGKLDSGFAYTFHIRARWLENGTAIEKTRSVDARAGQQQLVDFTRAAGEAAPLAVPR